MRFLNAVFGVLLWGLVLILAIVLMLDAFAGAGGAFGQVSRLTRFCLGATLVLLPVLRILIGVRERRTDRSLTFKTDGGPVSVSVQAITGLLTRLEDEFPDITHLRANVVPRRGAIDVLLDVRVRGGEQVTDTCRLLQQRARDSLAENLGVSHVRHVQVNVRELVPGASHGPSRPPDAPPEPTPSEPDPEQGIGA